MRNFYEKVSKVTDSALANFEYVPHLRKLEIQYTRYFDYECVPYLSMYFRNLEYLNLSGCPIQESMAPLV